MLTYDRKLSQTRSDTAAKIDKRYPQRRTLATAKIDPTQVAHWSNWGAASDQHIQTKLTVSQPDDVLEREADHVADQVMRTSDPASSDSVALSAYSDHPLSMSRDDLLPHAENQTEEQLEEPIHRACDSCTSAAAADDDDGTVRTCSPAPVVKRRIGL